jgi:hypothetical protein
MIKWLFRIGLGFVAFKLAEAYVGLPSPPKDEDYPSPRKTAAKRRRKR